MKGSIGLPLLILLFSAPALCCISVPRNVALKNSPFFMDHVSVSAYGMDFKTLDGSEIGIGCDKNKEGKYFWNVSEKAPGAEKAELYDNLSEISFMDEDEVPLVTQVDLATNEEAAYGIIKLTDRSDDLSSISIYCTKTNSHITSIVKFVNHEGQVVGELNLSHMYIARSIGSPYSDAQIDFKSSEINPAIVNGGCGSGASIGGEGSQGSSRGTK